MEVMSPLRLWIPLKLRICQCLWTIISNILKWATNTLIPKIRMLRTASLGMTIQALTSTKCFRPRAWRVKSRLWSQVQAQESLLQMVMQTSIQTWANSRKTSEKFQVFKLSHSTKDPPRRQPRFQVMNLLNSPASKISIISSVNQGYNQISKTVQINLHNYLWRPQIFISAIRTLHLTKDSAVSNNTSIIHPILRIVSIARSICLKMIHSSPALERNHM